MWWFNPVEGRRLLTVKFAGVAVRELLCLRTDLTSTTQLSCHQTLTLAHHTFRSYVMYLHNVRPSSQCSCRDPKSSVWMGQYNISSLVADCLKYVHSEDSRPHHRWNESKFIEFAFLSGYKSRWKLRAVKTGCALRTRPYVGQKWVREKVKVLEQILPCLRRRLFLEC